MVNGNGVINVKKSVVWFIAGFIAATAFSAHAEVLQMIGKQVDGVFDLTINNQKMEYQAVLIDGTTYAPVRMLGEATGFIVRFNEDTGIKLVKKIVTPRVTVLKTIEVLNGSISRNRDAIKRNEEEINRLSKEVQSELVLMDIQNNERSIERQNQGIIELNEKIAKLNQTLADIDAQEAELANP